MGTYAHAEGIMLTYTMIALKTGSTLNGAAYAQTAVTLDATTLRKPNYLTTCGSPSSGSNPGSVLLCTAGSYAILSKSGVSTTPGSVVYGNVGTSPIAVTALTGFGLVPGPFEEEAFLTSTMVFGTLSGASHLPPHA